jgi:hypothetical protein
VAPLDRLGMPELVVLGARGEIVACGHREAVREQVRSPQDNLMTGESWAPTTPETIAKVVTAPSMPP